MRTYLPFFLSCCLLLPVTSHAERLSLAERVQRLEQQKGGNNPALVDALMRLDQLQEEVQTLRGLVEEQQHLIQQMRQQQKDQYLDLDRRLQQLAGAQTGATVHTPVAGMQPAAMPRPVQQTAPVRSSPQPVAADAAVPATPAPVTTAAPAVRESLPPPAETVALGAAGTATAQALPDPEQERQAYEDAFRDLKDGHYADAAKKFEAFVQRWPASDYADNAQYWLGESYYVTRNYRIALDAFQQLVQRYPDSSKLPDALLKIGYTYFELKDWDQARNTLKQVSERYPGTTVAKLAEKRLKMLALKQGQ